MNQNVHILIKKLNSLDVIITTNRRDTKPFIKAEKEYESIVFGVMPPQDYGAIVRRIGRVLNNTDLANIIIASRKGTSIQSIIHNYRP